MKSSSTQNGFTIIELMTVAVIISILASIAIPNFMNANIRAKVARSIAEQELLVWALESYYLDNDTYPPNKKKGEASAWDLVPVTTPIPYISSLPSDIFLAPPTVDRKEFVKEQRHGNESYFYVNFIQATGERISIAPYGQYYDSNFSGSANYIVYGYGPLFVKGFDPMEPKTLIEYQPSR
ncbi:MAG: prepilin-type N-terminal cleavage/methylation domain-containing protein, partial [bacterium]